MHLFKNQSFAHKIALTSVIATVIAVCTLLATFLLLDVISSRRVLNTDLAALADVVGQTSTAALTFRDQLAAQEVLNALRTEPPIVAACLYDAAGARFAQYQRQPGAQGCPAARTQILSPTRDFPSVIRPIVLHDEFLGSVLLVSDVQELKKRWKRLLFATVGMLIVALTFSGIAGSSLQRGILKPISDLTGVMRNVTEEQKFSARVAVSGNDEIAHLGKGFNAMLCELERRENQKKKFEAQLEYQASNDALTGLPNRRLFSDRLVQALATAERVHRNVAILYIDLDGFKLVNDSLGHPVGDSLLVEVAARFSAAVRKSDTLARIGGDEFTVILTNLHAREDALAVAMTLVDTLDQPFHIECHQLTISASIGISLYPHDALDSAHLMQQADAAMYAAKRNGKNQVMYFTPDLGVLVRERLNLENQLRDALANGEIFVQYQPEFDVLTKQLVRFEALARWNHPTLGSIPPDKFIPVAEESGLITPLGAYILESACVEAIRWQSISPYPIQIAVNVSNIQFSRPTFVEEVSEIILRTGIDPRLLQLELTESVMVEGINSSAESMRRLKAIGVTFAIDDFGTGYSCLSYLPALPFDALKIDRSFIKTSHLSVERRLLVQSLISLAQNIGLRVIVEGVETVEQLELIQKLGGNEIQGYLLGRPTTDPTSKIVSMREMNEPLASPTDILVPTMQPVS